MTVYNGICDMKTMNISDFTAALERAGKIKGEHGVVLQKKLILDNYMIVDAEGMAVDPEELDVVVKPCCTDMHAGKRDRDEMTEESVAKSVRKTLAEQVTSRAYGVVAKVDAPWENARVYGGVKYLKNKESAWKFGTWCLAAMGHGPSAAHCKNLGISLIRTKGHTESVNSAGGFLVPDEFENELITLREQYGVFRRNARVVPMTSDTKRIPKRTNTVTAYFVGEASAITESQQTFDQVQLVAKKLGVLTTVSSELNEDSVVNIGDDIANEIAYAFSLKEDDSGFNGDGSSTYGGIVGLLASLTDSNQVSDGAASTYAAVTLTELSNGLRKLPAWASLRNNIKVYCSKNAYHGVFERLALAAGGNNALDIANGFTAPRWYGYPVEFAQVIPVTESANATFAYIGDLQQACIFGDRRANSIAFSDSALNAFEQDEIAVRGTERFDIVCANVGGFAASGAMIRMVL
jgi:HK97 family phage major capsid protein